MPADTHTGIAAQRDDMDTELALALVRPLADGVDPITGEAFPSDSPYQHPQVVRALMVATAALETQRTRDRRRQGLPSNAGTPWSSSEDDALLRGFDAGRSFHELAASHQRTVAAIQARLVKLGKLADEPSSGHLE